MAETNVYRLPVEGKAEKGEASRTRGTIGGGDGRGLFGYDAGGKGKVVFLSVGDLTEEKLLTVLVRNSVKAVIDLRPRAVFPKPRFRHKRIIEYFHEWNIIYVEYVMLARDGRGKYGKERPDDYIEEALETGLALCLFDEEARAGGRVKEFRQRLVQARNFGVELSSRALVGL